MTPAPRTTPLGPNIWVVRHRTGFAVRQEGRGGNLTPPIPQRDAIDIARRIARANNSELLVQGRHGRIRFRDSHGCDPFPPKG